MFVYRMVYSLGCMIDFSVSYLEIKQKFTDPHGFEKNTITQQVRP